ncbi:MAG TPA: hypothetical protein VM736_14775 [Gemmatimonadales bacterium]|nr:hypothetical protein [Gemmatimonadales bacterium]
MTPQAKIGRSRWRRAAAAVVVASALGAAASSAQASRPEFAVAVGRAIPVGAFHADATGEGFDAGWTASARLTVKGPRPRLGLRFDAGFSTNGANDQLKTDLSKALGQPSDETITLVGANAALTYALAPNWRVTPSVFGGLGLWYVSLGVTSGSGSTHTSGIKPAWHLGGELSYRGLFLDMAYVSVPTVAGLPRSTFFPITLGYRFAGGSPT